MLWRVAASGSTAPGPSPAASSSGCLAAAISRCGSETLWRLLYETAARANELLALDVKDVDLANRRARVHSKGGAVEWGVLADRVGPAPPPLAGRPDQRTGLAG